MAMFHFRLKSDKKPNGTKISAVKHVEYINREKAFSKRGGCIFHAHHLPKWAKNDPKKFFQAADKYEGKGNRRYMEIEFALPNELTTVEQYRQIIAPFLEKHLKNHYYAYHVFRTPHAKNFISSREFFTQKFVSQYQPELNIERRLD